jgi:hypothetical protein
MRFEGVVLVCEIGKKNEDKKSILIKFRGVKNLEFYLFRLCQIYA